MGFLFPTGLFPHELHRTLEARMLRLGQGAGLFVGSCRRLYLPLQSADLFLELGRRAARLGFAVHQGGMFSFQFLQPGRELLLTCLCFPQLSLRFPQRRLAFLQRRLAFLQGGLRFPQLRRAGLLTLSQHLNLPR